MRTLASIPLALLTAACWTPGPSPLERQFYQWELPRRQASYCIVSLDTGSGAGITPGGGQAVHMACAVPPAAPPAAPRRSPRIEAIGQVPPF